jgi:hypothetical protein
MDKLDDTLFSFIVCKMTQSPCGQDPLLCPRCGTPMDWELLYHPQYGILKEAQLFEEDPPHERTASECSGLATADDGGNPVARPIALVQLPLPFL